MNFLTGTQESTSTDFTTGKCPATGLDNVANLRRYMMILGTDLAELVNQHSVENCLDAPITKPSSMFKSTGSGADLVRKLSVEFLMTRDLMEKETSAYWMNSAVTLPLPDTTPLILVYPRRSGVPLIPSRRSSRLMLVC